MRRNKKRGQMEIMGLAIVFVLVTLGLLFFVKLKQTGSKSLREEFKEGQMSANMLTAVLRLTAQDCDRNSILELYQDCSSYKTSLPDEKFIGSIRCNPAEEGPMMSCDYLGMTTFNILNRTLAKWNKDFMFKVCVWNNIQRACKEGEIITLHQKGECKGEIESKSTPVQARSKILMLRLDICKPS